MIKCLQNIPFYSCNSSNMHNKGASIGTAVYHSIVWYWLLIIKFVPDYGSFQKVVNEEIN